MFNAAMWDRSTNMKNLVTPSRLLAIAGASLLVAGSAAATEVVVTICETNQYQVMEGFGGALTESAAWLFQNALTTAQRSNLLHELFATNNGGIGLSYLRQPIGASDFRLQDYTYDDRPAGQTDYGLTNFSISHDTNCILPILREIRAINTNIALMGTAWSAPAWMKTTTNLYSGSLKTDAHSAYAAYLLKFVQAYAATGLPIAAITLQNEPLYEPWGYPGTYMGTNQQVAVAIRVGQLFQSNGVSTRILCYDHNWDQFNYPITVLNNTTARQYLAGTAFHGYAGDVAAQSIVHDAHPDKDIYFTEMTSGTWSTNFGANLMWDASYLLIGATRNWAKTVIKWNLALSQSGGPKAGGGCNGCSGIVTINTNSGAITRNHDYYALAHLSQFVRPGARRVESSESSADGPFTVAFINSDSSMVVAAYNPTAARDYVFRWQNQSFNYPLPATSLVTFAWANRAGATVDVWITTGSKSKLLEKQAAGPVFRPLAIEWQGRTWFVRDAEGNPGNNRWSADGVRVDSNGWLRLQARNQFSNWYCAQVVSADSPGFGTYRWQTVGRPDQWHTNIAATLGTLFDLGHELDISFGADIDDPPTNLAYAVQPYYQAGHRTALAYASTNTRLTHEIVWSPRTVAYRGWFGHDAAPAGTAAVFAAWTYEGTDVPGDTNEQVRMNIWLINGAAPTVSQELVIAGFTYYAATGAVFSDDFEDAPLGAGWTAYSNGGQIAVNGDGQLRLTPAAADNASAACAATNPLTFAPDGFSYCFSAQLSSASVTQARSAGGADIWAWHALVSGPTTASDPYAASNAAILLAGYDASADTLTLQFQTKTNQPNHWGRTNFIAAVEGVSSFFGGTGLELRVTLVYSNYQVSVLHSGNPVAVTVLAGADSGPHQLGNALTDARFLVGARNHDDGRGGVYWSQAGHWIAAELDSTAITPDGNGGSGTLVQLGDGNNANTWRQPISAQYQKARAQVLYRANQIAAAGTITQLQIKVLAPPDIELQGYTIRMQLTALTNLSSAFINTGWKTVYQTNTTIPSGTSGWYAFKLMTNFHYPGGSNLLVDFIVNSATRDDTPPAAATFTYGSGVQGAYAGHKSGDPFTWPTVSGKNYQYYGNKYVDLRLAISNDPVPVLGLNLSFEDGPRGYLTNVPHWQVEGSTLSGYIKSTPVHHGTNALKLWKGPGAGDQKLFQFFNATASNEYRLDGYILSLGSEPFTGSNAWGALQLEWYGVGGLLGIDSSQPFTSSNTYGVWTPAGLATVPPAGTTSGRIVCALFSCDDQAGSLYFDDLGLTQMPAPPPDGNAPIPATRQVCDEFNDTTMSNIWTISWGGGPDAYVEETNGFFRVKPGANFSQSTGYTTPATWSNTNGWQVFSATLATMSVDTVKSGNDLVALLGICSEADNPWWVNSSISLYGYYDRDNDQIWWQFLTKSNAPAANGTDRFNCTMYGVSRYLNGANRLRVSIALGQGQYEVRFSDTNGLPVSYTTYWGGPRGNHYLGNRLNSAYWYVGAQADGTNRGWVAWDRTDVYANRAPAAELIAAWQTADDGSGTVTFTGRVADANGDACRIQLQASTNGGGAWFNIYLSAIAGTWSAALAPTQAEINAYRIQTTNTFTGLAATNTLTGAWVSRHAANGSDLNGVWTTNVRLRIIADDGDVSAPYATGAVFALDNQPPSPGLASVTVAGGAAYTFDADLAAVWTGFSDAGAGVVDYYFALQDNSGTSSGSWTLATAGTAAGAIPGISNTVYVWAGDGFGNIGAAAAGSILVLNPGGDYDGDGIADGWEPDHGLSPLNPADSAADDDNDGYSNLQEYLFGTAPNSAASAFNFDGVPAPRTNEFVIQWTSATDRYYSVITRGALTGAWSEIQGWIDRPGTGGAMSYTGAMNSVQRGYYRIRVRVP